MTCPTCKEGICTQGCAMGTRPRASRRAKPNTLQRPALQDFNPTALLLMYQYNCVSVELDRVMGMFGYNNKSEANRAASTGDLPVPVFKYRDSTRAPYLIHIEDLAKFIDQQRAKAQAEINSWQGRKAA